jgi:hydrogenase maturation protease
MTAAASTVEPILVFGWGNPSRGDDALGPMFVEQASAMTCAAHSPGIEYLTDFQVQVEHALDLRERKRVLFIDASVDTAAPFECLPLRAQASRSATTHSMSPAAVMQVFERLHGHASPPCTLLAIRGLRFELGEPLSEAASNNLAQALTWFSSWLAGTVDNVVNAGARCTN